MKNIQPKIPDGRHSNEQSGQGVSGPGSYPELESPPAWAPVWLPIQFLNRKIDNTYLVRVENGKGGAYIDKAYFADDEGLWYEGNLPRDPYVGIMNAPTELGPWKVTAFAPWPEAVDIVVRHASDCATSCTPAYPAGKCDCGADMSAAQLTPSPREDGAPSMQDSSLNNSTPEPVMSKSGEVGPDRIWADLNMGIWLGEPQLDRRPCAPTEYVRGDVASDLLEALRAARNWMLCDNEFGDPEDFKSDLAKVDSTLSKAFQP